MKVGETCVLWIAVLIIYFTKIFYLFSFVLFQYFINTCLLELHFLSMNLMLCCLERDMMRDDV